MAKRHLYAWMRAQLRDHVNKNVHPVAEKKAMDAAYKKALKPILAVVHKKWPVKDMAVLEKHGVSETAATINLSFPNGVVQQLAFDNDAPLCPNRGRYHQMFLVDQDTADAIEAFLDAQKVYNTERERRVKAYLALIDTSKYIEELVDVWPEAATLLPQGSVPTIMSPEMISLLHADQQERRVI